MEETKAIIGILVIAAISITAYFVIASGSSGAAVQPIYMTCCCNILAQDGMQVLVRSQLQTFASRTAPDCQSACEYNYAGQGKIFSQVGTCAENP
ncbi:MAG: hypothetical protein NTW67_06000 [Candidatus Woesearchaeota archaeon]|nr:hypothetical protein [Candidatus Woesearchaeota archaeon]